MELVKLKNKKKNKELNELLDILISLIKTIDETGEDFNLDEYFLEISKALETKGISLIFNMLTGDAKYLRVRFLNDVTDKKIIRKSIGYDFLSNEIERNKKHKFSKYYTEGSSHYFKNRKLFIEEDKGSKSVSLDSIVCPFEVRGQLIAYFDFLSDKLDKSYIDVFDVFVKAISRSVSSALLFSELRKSEKMFGDIFENADEGFYVLNGRKKKFIEVNKALASISGYTKDELLQMNYIALFAEDERKRIDVYVKERLEDKNSEEAPREYETKIACKDGTIKPIKLKVSRNINKEEWFVIISDISREKKAEERLFKINENQTQLNKLLLISIEDIPLNKKLEQLLNTSLEVFWTKNLVSACFRLLPEKEGEKVYLYSSKDFPKKALKECNINSQEICAFVSMVKNQHNGDEVSEKSSEKFAKKINQFCFPLTYKKNIFGSLCFKASGSNRKLSKIEIEYFRAVSHIFSGAIDREKNKLELAKSEEKYRDLVDHASDMFVMLDLDSNIVFTNRSFDVGFSSVKLPNNQFFDIVSEKDKEAVKKLIDKLIKNDKGIKAEFRTKSELKNNFVSASLSPIIKNGKKIAIQAIIRDISAAKKAEQKMFETKKHYLGVVDTIRDGILVIDKKNNIVSYNKVFAEKVGLQVEKIKNKKYQKILPLYENDLFKNIKTKKSNFEVLLKEVLERGEFVTYEKKAAKGKKTFYYKIDISPSRNRVKEVYQAVVTISNITENKEAEEEIRKLDEFKKRVLNNVPISIIIIDKKGKIISMNKHAQELMGEDASGRMLDDTKEIRKNTKLKNLYERLLENGESFKYTNLEYKSKADGEKRFLNIIAAPLFDSSNRVEGAISMAVDNTEPTIYKNRIEVLNQELEKKVKKRTSELDLANKKLNRALDLKLKFISDASHELRTPLTIMKGNLDLLSIDQKEGSGEIISVYDDIGDEIERMSRIISDLTMLTNADSEIEKISLDEVHLVSLIESVVKSLSVIAQDKEIDLGLVAPADEVVLTGDEAGLDKVFMNLVRNAIKYTDENGQVKIFIEPEDEGVLIRIWDTGIGIPENELNNIFERFYRVDKARSRAEGGTGLGLSICKWIVEAHNGSIKVKSIEGEGSEFSVYLPYSQNRQ
ncbi:hypothetical protein C0584_00840 [Candidatus Parcubacteria bacterium]|nr:MAG: hypothetical protein C0584_00840 [Candidatus Parcubacteria bacterium]